MSNTWQLQNAKNQLSRVIDCAISDGPQIITRRGVETVVLISMKEYTKAKKNKPKVIDLLTNHPLNGEELNIVRDKSLPRDIDL